MRQFPRVLSACALLLALALAAVPAAPAAAAPPDRDAPVAGFWQTLADLLRPLWGAGERGPTSDPDGAAAPDEGDTTGEGDRGPGSDPNGAAAPDEGDTTGEGDRGPGMDPDG